MNYFNSLVFRRQLEELRKCRFVPREELAEGVQALEGKKIVIVGCGSQGLNQGLNLRDSGLDVSYALQESALREKRPSWKNATSNKFPVGGYEELLPKADLVLNLTPDKQHTAVLARVMPLMKKGACLAFSHGFNIVEEGTRIRADLTVIMVAPKGPGTELRAEYERGFGVPTLIAVHGENDPQKHGMALAKAYAIGLGAQRAGVLESSFIAEVKSDLVGEQTILCGMLQSCSLLCFDRLVQLGTPAGYAAQLVQSGWEIITEALKQGGVTLMMERLGGAARVRAHALAEELKTLLLPLFEKHLDDVISGDFSAGMMRDWAKEDQQMLSWRKEIAAAPFEKTPAGKEKIPEQEYFDRGILMVAMVKAGVELAFEVMTRAGILPESAYYESLHETPLIANTIARDKLDSMNHAISDTAEYGSHLFTRACLPLLQDFMGRMGSDVLGEGLPSTATVDNRALLRVTQQLSAHPVEQIGQQLRTHMSAMRALH